MTMIVQLFILCECKIILTLFLLEETICFGPWVILHTLDGRAKNARP